MIDAKAQARFADKVRRTSRLGCWEWTAYRNPGGYGMFSLNGRNRLAHRVAFIAKHGRDPIGGIVRHRCDNPACVNPAHLVEGTQADNAADMMERGRVGGCVAEFVGITHCKRGHPFDDQNTRIRSDGGRECKTCERARLNKRRALLRARSNTRSHKRDDDEG